MTLNDLFQMVMTEKADNVKLSNEEGFNFLKVIMNKAALSKFRVTINYEQGKMLFEKIKTDLKV